LKWQLFLIKSGDYVLPNDVDLLIGIDCVEDTLATVTLGLLLIVADDRSCVVRVGVESSLQSGLVVVLSLDQRLASEVILALNFGRVELDVIRSPGSRMDPSAADPGENEAGIDVELDGVGDLLSFLLEDLVELLGLHEGPGEAVQDDASETGGSLHVLLDHSDDDFVRHELAALHHGLGLLADVRTLGHLVSQHVSRRQVANTVVLGHFRAVGALASAWWADEDYPSLRDLRASRASEELVEDYVVREVFDV
jgi:hypothetical protein